MFSANEAARRAKFADFWNVIRDKLVENFKTAGDMPQDAIDWYSRNLDYNVPQGELNRGMTVVDSVEILRERPLTDEEYSKSAVLGWCVEILAAFFFVHDDLMDSAVTRYGSFKQESYYVELLELFQEMGHLTGMGKLVDLITEEEDLNKFSLRKYSLLAIYKTSFFTYLLVALALRICGVPDSYVTDPSTGATIKPYGISKAILIPLGEYQQIQDDFLNVTATPAQIGKVGTDIVANKCSWVINTALGIATPEQRRILEQNYGIKPSEEEKARARNNGEEQGYLGEAEKRVKAVFEEMGIRQKYLEFEEERYKLLMEMIDTIPEGPQGQEGVLRREVFTSLLNKVYHFQK
ncbi:Farnesyl pyrophosphate synthetase [Marasmius crinis-equi]|uniref:Farnesyl pyrophosphate synthetase n=1 Tax=Marasmius crinis-equi TaxID=585013 RepID=A0ABR3FEB6_9AGAR